MGAEPPTEEPSAFCAWREHCYKKQKGLSDGKRDDCEPHERPCPVVDAPRCRDPNRTPRVAVIVVNDPCRPNVALQPRPLTRGGCKRLLCGTRVQPERP